LREAVAGFNKRHFKVDIDPSEIIIGPGTKQLIHMVFDIVRGDVILPSPSWIGYFPQIKLLDKHFHTFYMKPEDKYKIQPEDLDAFLAGVHKEQHILVLNNPHNPTGALYTEKELKAIADVLPHAQCFRFG
jgi:aspartate aminotransferase